MPDERQAVPSQGELLGAQWRSFRWLLAFCLAYGTVSLVCLLTPSSPPLVSAVGLCGGGAGSWALLHYFFIRVSTRSSTQSGPFCVCSSWALLWRLDGAGRPALLRSGS